MQILDARHLVKSVFIFIITMASCVCLAAGKQPAHYPKQLYGFWISATQECPHNSSFYDGDVMMDIQRDLLYGYEEASKPVHVELISKTPLTWRIESMIDIGPSGVFELDAPGIFVLSDDRLTVVSGNHTEVYKKCELKKAVD